MAGNILWWRSAAERIRASCWRSGCRTRSRSIEGDAVLAAFELLGIDAGDLAEHGPVLDLSALLPILNDGGSFLRGQHEARLQLFSCGGIHVYFRCFRAEICCQVIDDGLEFLRGSGGSAGDHIVHDLGPLLLGVVLGE